MFHRAESTYSWNEGDITVLRIAYVSVHNCLRVRGKRRHSCFPCRPFSECTGLLCTRYCGVGTYWRVETLRVICGTCCDSVGDESQDDWTGHDLVPDTRLNFYRQKVCSPHCPIRLAWTLCPELNQLHTSIRTLSKPWMRGVLSSRRLYFTVWYWEVCFIIGYSNQGGLCLALQRAR
jgi:hypothetical protein